MGLVRVPGEGGKERERERERQEERKDRREREREMRGEKLESLDRDSLNRAQVWSVPYPGHPRLGPELQFQRVFAGAQCDFIIMIIKVSVGSYGPIYSSMMSR